MIKYLTTQLVLLYCLTATASSALQVYTDEATWKSTILSDYVNEDLSGNVATTTVISTLTLVNSGIVLEVTEGFADEVSDFNFSPDVFGSMGGEVEVRLDPDFPVIAPQEITLTLLDPIDSIGLEFVGLNKTSARVYLALIVGGETIVPYEEIGSRDGFLGIKSDTMFDSLTLTSIQGASSGLQKFAITGVQTGNTTVSSVPEPSSFILLGLGVVGVISRRRRRQ